MRAYFDYAIDAITRLRHLRGRWRHYATSFHYDIIRHLPSLRHFEMLSLR